MKRWYRITVFSDYSAVCSQCARLGIATGQPCGLASFQVLTEPRLIMLLQLQFTDLRVFEYTTMAAVLLDASQTSPLAESGKSNFADLVQGLSSRATASRLRG